MAIGAIDGIDKKLARMYADKQTINLNNTTPSDPEQILNNLTMLAMNNKININIQLKKKMMTEKSVMKELA